jgi:hypothetical protein
VLHRRKVNHAGLFVMRVRGLTDCDGVAYDALAIDLRVKVEPLLGLLDAIDGHDTTLRKARPEIRGA